jgi:hypothetical protein
MVPSGVLVKETLYNNILEFMYSIFIEYEKCCFQYKSINLNFDLLKILFYC